jgi:hypothetical protein
MPHENALATAPMQFTIVGEIRDSETIAAGPGIRVVSRLRQQYGAGRWRKRKGIATVEMRGGAIHEAEITGTRRPGSASGNSRSSES